MSDFRLYVKDSWQWFCKKSQTRTAEIWLGVYSFLESFVLPVPTDIFLALMILANRARAVRFVILTTLSSVLGAVALYTVTYFVLNAFVYELLGNLGLSYQVSQAALLLQEYAFATVFLGAFTPIPYTPVVLAAGVLQVNIAVLIAASLLGRGLRYAIVGALMFIFGAAVLPRLNKYAGVVTVSLAIIGVMLVLVAKASGLSF